MINEFLTDMRLIRNSLVDNEVCIGIVLPADLADPHGSMCSSLRVFIAIIVIIIIIINTTQAAVVTSDQWLLILK